MAGNLGFAKSAQTVHFSSSLASIFLEIFWTSKFGPTSKLCQKGFLDDIWMSGPDAKCLRFFVFCLRTVRDFRVFVHKKEVAQKKRKKKSPNRFFGYSPRNKLRIRGKHLKAV